MSHATECPPSCKILPWDSEFFGFPIATLTETAPEKRALEEALRWCQSNDIECLYWLADGGDDSVPSLAVEFQFNFVDVRSNLEASPIIVKESSSDTLRTAKSDDIDILKQLARAAHANSRFFRDSRFRPEKSADLFERWIDRDFIDPHVMVWVNVNEQDAATGYVSCRRDPDLADSGSISLIAVSAEARGRGVGADLLNQAMRWLKEKGASKARVVTQGANIAAQRLYQKAGFVPCKTDYWFHKWFKHSNSFTPLH